MLSSNHTRSSAAQDTNTSAGGHKEMLWETKDSCNTATEAEARCNIYQC